MTDESRQVWIITGGAGFIGSNFVRHVLATTAHRVVVFDALTYAGNPESLAGIDEDTAFANRYRFVHGGITDRAALTGLVGEEAPTVIVNFAAESHVDRSIHDATPFLTTNVVGTQCVLDVAHELGVSRVLQVSTDEVYGTLAPDDPPFNEHSPLAPNSPYAASKASADLMCRAAFRTRGQDVVLTRCSNNYGPYQFPEKLIPLMIIRALADERLPVYGDGQQVRDWLHVRDHCSAICAAIEHGEAGGIYNIGGDAEHLNMLVVRTILAHLGKPDSLIEHVTDRPGHDRRYAIDFAATTAALGWRPTVGFEAGMAETIDWYVANETWWRRVMSGEYREWISKHYGGRG